MRKQADTMPDFNISLDGMSRAGASIDRTASRIARLSTSVQAAPAEDAVDLSAEMIALLQARSTFEANIKAARTMDEIQKSLLDVLG